MNLITQDPAPLDENTRIIPLTKGFVTLVDKDDYERLMRWRWCVSVISGRPHAVRMCPMTRRLIYMPREILGLIAGDRREVDHKNHDTLDNRHSNIRIANRAQNNWNTRRHRDNTSGFKGIDWRKKERRWRARLQVNGKRIHLGLYLDVEAAVKAYRDASKQLQGEYACSD